MEHMVAEECSLKFDEEKHEYYCITHLGRRLPSVSEVLSEVSIAPSYDSVNPRVLEHARDKGRAVHQAIELLEADELDFETVDERIVCYLKAYQAYRQNHPAPVVAETRVGSCMLGYAGTADVIEGDGEDRKLVEVKTTSRIYRSAHVQATAYSVAANIDKTAVLHLKKDGTYHLHPVPRSMRTIWAACMTVYNYKMMGLV